MHHFIERSQVKYTFRLLVTVNSSNNQSRHSFFVYRAIYQRNTVRFGLSKQSDNVPVHLYILLENTFGLKRMERRDKNCHGRQLAFGAEHVDFSQRNSHKKTEFA
jgi:hypothetical protein